MIQITFQAAFDPFHTVFRFLRIFSAIKDLGDVTIEQIRILDFYLLFPFRSDEVRLLPAHRKYKKMSTSTVHLKPYGDLPNSFVLFGRMGPIQTAALDTLVSKGYLDRGAYSVGYVRLSEKKIDPVLVGRIDKLNSEQAEIVTFLRVLVSEYAPSGKEGLKSRTGLMEYRYDAV